MPSKKKLRKRVQRKLHEDCWSLDRSTIDFFLPRLKHFRAQTYRKGQCGYPVSVGSMEKWQEILGTMIYFVENLELYTDGESVVHTPEEKPFIGRERVEKHGQVLYRLIPNPNYKVEYFFGMDAIKRFRDAERFSLGRKNLLKYFFNLWL